MGPLIFLLDKQPPITQVIREYLEEAGYNVHAFSELQSLPQAIAKPPALIVLGSGFSEKDISAVRFLGTNGSEKIPLIVLLDDASEERRLAVLEAGADDCIVKPLLSREFAARVQAILRRSALPQITECSDNAELIIDTWSMKLLVHGIEVPTTTLEFRLIEYLARHRGQVFTRDFLLDAVWGEMQFITPRSVDACIRRIREKIEPDRSKPTLLKTVRGVGYRWDARMAWKSADTLNCDCHACRTQTSALRDTALRTRAHSSRRGLVSERESA